jgi:hypothetical protein
MEEGAELGKKKIRNPNVEIRNKFKAENTKAPNGFDDSDFVF